MDAEAVVRVKPDLARYMGTQVEVEVDRPLGSIHPRHPDIVYPVNYGYIPGTTSGDGMPVDAYILGIEAALTHAKGVVIAVIQRDNDYEDKLIVSTDPGDLDAEKIRQATAFMEQYYRSHIIMAEDLMHSVGRYHG